MSTDPGELVAFLVGFSAGLSVSLILLFRAPPPDPPRRRPGRNRPPGSP